MKLFVHFTFRRSVGPSNQYSTVPGQNQRTMRMKTKMKTALNNFQIGRINANGNSKYPNVTETTQTMEWWKLGHENLNRIALSITLCVFWGSQNKRWRINQHSSVFMVNVMAFLVRITSKMLDTRTPRFWNERKK